VTPRPLRADHHQDSHVVGKIDTHDRSGLSRGVPRGRSWRVAGADVDRVGCRPRRRISTRSRGTASEASSSTARTRHPARAARAEGSEARADLEDMIAGCTSASVARTSGVRVGEKMLTQALRTDSASVSKSARSPG
jgi:hypothetical protein